jgi:hypothetical protein
MKDKDGSNKRQRTHQDDNWITKKALTKSITFGFLVNHQNTSSSCFQAALLACCCLVVGQLYLLDFVF